MRYYVEPVTDPKYDGLIGTRCDFDPNTVISTSLLKVKNPES